MESGLKEKAVNFTISKKPQLEMEEMLYELKEGRKNMAFDFCFQLHYPNADEANVKECIYQYSRYTKLAEKIFAQYIR